MKVVGLRSCKGHPERLSITTSLESHMHIKGLRLGLRRYFVHLQRVNLHISGAKTEEAEEMVRSPPLSFLRNLSSLSCPLYCTGCACAMLQLELDGSPHSDLHRLCFNHSPSPFPPTHLEFPFPPLTIRLCYASIFALCLSRVLTLNSFSHPVAILHYKRLWYALLGPLFSPTSLSRH